MFGAVVLCGLTRSPEMAAKRARRACKLGREIIGLVRVRRASSTNKFTLKLSPAYEIPLMLGSAHRAITAGSRARIKWKGDRGEPCLFRLCIGNEGEKQPE